MNKNIIRFSLFFALSLAFMSLSAHAQATTTTTTDKFPISFTTTNCSEVVELTGTLTLITHSTVSNSGHIADKQSFNLSLKGFGTTSGASFVGNQSSQMNRTSDGTDGNPSTFTAIGHVNIIGQGSSPNFRQYLLIHSTFNANGGATAFQDQFSVDCN